MKKQWNAEKPSHQKQMRRKWWLYGGIGLALMGAGLSVFGEALMLKYQSANFWHWAGLGTLSLVLFNSGMSFFGDAIKTKILMEQNQ